jgi:16S rRNA processing protein RimM
VELFLTGIILKPKGLKGELKVKPVTDFPERFLKRREYYVGKTPEEAAPRKMLSAKLNQGFAWIMLEGVGSRDEAEAMAGNKLYVPGDALEPMPDGRAYIHDLIGLEVFDEDEGRVGTISEVLQMPAHDVYEIDAGERKVLVPAVEDFITEIDLEKRIVTLRRFREFL